MVNQNQEENKITIVVKNETTMEELSEKLEYDLDELLKYNNYELDEVLEKGTEIVLNKKEIDKDEYRSYKIKENDTRKSIAKNFGIKKSSLEKIDMRLKTNESIK